MAAYFFDSSALVKRYATEAGTAWVTALLDPMARNRIYIARITGVEVVSALTRKQRGQFISVVDAAAAITRFRQDFANRFRIVEVTAALTAVAMSLAETYALRGYDAVQLAAAHQAQQRRLARGIPPLSLTS